MLTGERRALSHQFPWRAFKDHPSAIVASPRTHVDDPVSVRHHGLVMLDHEGYLALYERYRDGNRLRLKPGRRAFRIEGDGAFDGNHNQVATDATGLRLNAGSAGKSGRRKLCVVDWNRDGKLDLIVNSANANILLNLGQRDGVTTFRDLGPVDELKLAGHDTSPTTVDWNNDGVRELLLGAEDGHFYYLEPAESK